MKKRLYSFFVLSSIFGMELGVAQEPTRDKFFFNEFYFNGNVCLPQYKNNFWGGGAGLGIAHVAFKEMDENFIFGMEINSFSTYSPTFSDDKYASYKNVKAGVLAIDLPFMYRRNFGQSMRFYCQIGFSIDLNLVAGGSGLVSSYGPTSQSPTLKDQPTNSIPLQTKTSFTPRAGVGYKTIVKKRNFAIQMDYLNTLSPMIAGGTNGSFQSQYLRLNLCMSSKN